MRMALSMNLPLFAQNRTAPFNWKRTRPYARSLSSLAALNTISSREWPNFSSNEEPLTNDGLTSLLQELIKEASTSGTHSGVNVIAYSGGVDSSLTAHIVKAAFPSGNVYACIGKSESLSKMQLENARHTASFMNIPLIEVDTFEGDVQEYVANEGNSCYYCKTTLYSTLTSVGKSALLAAKDCRASSEDVVIFNGTNADDLRDLSRVGLLAAMQFNVSSPLASVSKQSVRRLAKLANLPNWDLAAAPCLRSRLEYGVRATSHNLKTVEQAENMVRELLHLESSDNMRIRLMSSGSTAVLEVDPHNLQAAMAGTSILVAKLLDLGLGLETIRAFKSGSLSQMK